MYNKIVNLTQGVSFDLQTGIVEFRVSKDHIQCSRLGKKDRDVLKFLANHVGCLVTKDEILNTVWHDRIVCENTVAVSLSNIRRFLRKADVTCACLINISGSGYIFNPAKSGFELEARNKGGGASLY